MKSANRGMRGAIFSGQVSEGLSLRRLYRAASGRLSRSTSHRDPRSREFQTEEGEVQRPWGRSVSGT